MAFSSLPRVLPWEILLLMYGILWLDIDVHNVGTTTCMYNLFSSFPKIIMGVWVFWTWIIAVVSWYVFFSSNQANMCSDVTEWAPLTVFPSCTYCISVLLLFGVVLYLSVVWPKYVFPYYGSYSLVELWAQLILLFLIISPCCCSCVICPSFPFLCVALPPSNHIPCMAWCTRYSTVLNYGTFYFLPIVCCSRVTSKYLNSSAIPSSLPFTCTLYCTGILV